MSDLCCWISFQGLSGLYQNQSPDFEKKGKSTAAGPIRYRRESRNEWSNDVYFAQ